MSPKQEAKTKHNGHDPETAKIIAQHLKDTPEDQMQETTYIPLRLVHVLSMLQALEGQYVKLQRQLIEVNNWEAKQKDTDFQNIEPDEELLKEASHNLFIHMFRNALHQYYRGKDGMFLEKMVILADTDLQTRGGTGIDDLFKRNVREQ